MAINKAKRTAMKALSQITSVDVKKTYEAERTLETVRAKMRFKPPLYQTWDFDVICGGHSVPVRIFRPRIETAKGILLFIHGGGWVTGNIDSYDRVCGIMSRKTGKTVISVDYSLAPEHPFQIGLEDCYAATKAILQSDIKGAGADQLTLIGDSAGGNLAAAVSLLARDRGEFQIQRQILIYPATNNDHSETSPYPSVMENGFDYILTAKRVSEFMDLYQSCEEDKYNPYFAPLLEKDYSNQPRTLIITAEFCPLRDEGEEYGRRLLKAGNDVTVYRVRDAIHGFFSLPPRHPHVKRAYLYINRFLRGD